jgi:Holliday junction resolvase RusA-like endonuclease
MIPDIYQQKALKSWQFDNDLVHVSAKLAGEAGEITDQYAKSVYKPTANITREDFLDELGDWSFYWRLCAYFLGYSCEDIYKHFDWQSITEQSTFRILSAIQIPSTMVFSYVLNDFPQSFESSIVYNLGEAFKWMMVRLKQLNCTFDELIEINYTKLNSDSSHHGWAKPFSVFIPCLPPGINQTYKTTKNGGFYKSDEAKVWQDEASKIIGAKAGELDYCFPADAEYKFELDFYFQRPNADIDRSIKVLLDTCAEKLGFDDKRVMEVNLKKHVKESDETGVNVVIKQLF